MKLKVKRKLTPAETYEEKKPREKKEKTTKTTKKLPPDIYKPIFDPMRFLVRESPSSKDPTNMVKQYLEISVKRFDDEIGLPYVFIQMYQESNTYTGYLKGKSIYLPLEMLYDLIERLEGISTKCDELGIE